MKREFTSIQQIVVHHSASPRKTRLEEIRGWHHERGFTDIGYHYVIEDGGLIRWARDERITGAHAKGANQGSIGICVTGDNTQLDQTWSELQWFALRRLVRGLLSVHDLANGSIRAHNEAGTTATDCPGMSGDDLRLRLFQGDTA